ncbi:unnamed protein product [Ilex paraguariensis]|uniref:TCP domain-containing protein n=1 Tax=Ilex paraguariensis TaxID=185542 RepID=A0ABC8RVR1_9AQUA
MHAHLFIHSDNFTVLVLAFAASREFLAASLFLPFITYSKAVPKLEEGSSNLDYPSNQEPLLDEEDQAKEEEEKEEEDDHEDGQHKATQQWFHGHNHQQQRNHYGKTIDTHQAKWPNFFSTCSNLAFEHKNKRYETLGGGMQEGLGQAPPKLRLKRKKGDVVDIHGGRIVRSTGRKDRHSKVCTAKGPKDRRVRLSANTAIQFYDVQDRLGCDRPSKAIDWLMQEAKAAIDALNELPARDYYPLRHDDPSYTTEPVHQHQQLELHLEEHSPNHIHHQTQQESEFTYSEYEIHDQQQSGGNPIGGFGFFSTTGGSAPSSSIDFHHHHHPGDQISRIKSQNQGFSLSFLPFQDEPICLHHHSSPFHSTDHQQGLFTSSTPLDFNVTTEMGHFPVSNSGNAGGIKGFVFDSMPPGLGQNQLFWQREPLQSSSFPSIHTPMKILDSNVSFTSNFSSGENSEFSVLLGIQSQEKENPVSNKPSSAITLLHYQD